MPRANEYYDRQVLITGDDGAEVGADHPLPTTATLSVGAPIDGQVLEPGGSGLLGWLSSLRKAFTDRLGTLGQKAMAASAPVTLASDQSAIPITDATYSSPGPATGGQVTATNAAVALVNHACSMFRVKCDPANTSSVYFGPAGVTTAGVNAWWVGAAGDDTGWIPLSNPDIWYAIAASGSPLFYITYMN